MNIRVEIDKSIHSDIYMIYAYMIYAGIIYFDRIKNLCADVAAINLLLNHLYLQ